ncbi:MAG: histidine triad nucleotide-binding protein [Acutalibacteraceae bacterium]
MMDCIFCKIIKKEIPSKIIYEDDKILVFNDLNPIAPVHALIIPKAHISSANDITSNNVDIIAYIFSIIPKIATKLGINSGYRIINNCGENGGQSVKHIHFHLVGGKKLSWPNL